MSQYAAHVDFETRSATDLRKSGVYRYCEDPTTATWGFSWWIGDGQLNRWRPGYPDPVALLDHIRNGGLFVAHNAGFERRVWNVTLRQAYGLSHWPELRIEQQSCTMARASAMALPGDLDTLAVVLNTVNRKDREGHNLMMKMSKPKKRNPNGTFEWHDDPADIARLEAYQDQDVRTETEVDGMVPSLSPYEQKVWELDQRINDRGVYVDEVLITRAVDVVLEAKKRADAKMNKLTGGAVKKVTEVAKIVAFLETRGVFTDSMRKGDQDELIAMAAFSGDTLVRKVVELRKSASKTSVSKYSKMLDCICLDSRIRGLLEYCGARKTGRWSGRLVQPQNFPRVDPDKDGDLVAYTAAVLTMVISASDACDMLEMAGYEPLEALSKTLRGAICAAPGNKLIGGDFSNVEGRVNAWLAGETWKLQAFRDYDNKVGPDLYQVAYARSFGVDISTVGKGHKRQIGKVQELACGYQGGVGAYITMGDTYGVKPYDLVKPVMDTTNPMDWDAMAIKYAKASDKFGLPEDQWTAIKLIVMNWRAANPNIMQGWWDAADAAIQAVSNPFVPVGCYGGRVQYMSVNDWLYCQLPSGRVLCYSNPHIRESVVQLVNAKGEEYERTKRTVWYVGLDSITRQWREMYMYGGEQCNNIVQGTSRCLMDHAMFRVEAAGYPLVLTVHDELLSEVRKEFGSVPEFKGLMAVLPVWAGGLPVEAAAWEDQRYVK